MLLINQPGKDIPQLLWHHIYQLLLGDLLDSLILLGNLRVEILNRRRQIAGEHLRGVVVHRQQGDAFRVSLAAKLTVFDRRQSMGNHRYLQAMLGDVLGTHVAHQRPAVDQFQAGEMGEEVALTRTHNGPCQ